MVRLAEPVAVVPTELEAVTVQVPVPAAGPVVDTMMLPLVPEPLPVAPEQDTDAEVALLVDQLKVEALPAVTDVGENAAEVTLGAGTPVPDRLTLAMPPPLWVKLSVPEREPSAAGVNDTLTVQVPLTATLPQLLDWAKSLAPAEMPTPENVRVFVPVLVTVTVWVADVVPVRRGENVTLEGEMLA